MATGWFHALSAQRYGAAGHEPPGRPDLVRQVREFADELDPAGTWNGASWCLMKLLSSSARRGRRGGVGSRPVHGVIGARGAASAAMANRCCSHAHALAAISALPEDQRRVYSDLIEASLSEAAREVLIILPQNQPFYSEFGRRSYERGVGEGKARGKAEALLKFLALRGLAISDVQRCRILECADATTIDGWLDRALSVVSVDELLG